MLSPGSGSGSGSGSGLGSGSGSAKFKDQPSANQYKTEALQIKNKTVPWAVIKDYTFYTLGFWAINQFLVFYIKKYI